jgi:hypothetical protein
VYYIVIVYKNELEESKMSTITIEKIDLLRERANVSYREAKEALEKCGGDVVEALSHLEEENKIKPEEKPFKTPRFIEKIKDLISKANEIKVVISKNGKNILNIPSTLAILFIVLALPAAVVFLVIALIAGCRIRLCRENGKDPSINSKIEKVTDAVNGVTNKIKKEFADA